MSAENYPVFVDELTIVAEALGDPLRVKILDVLAAGRDKAACSPVNEDVPGAVCACDVAAELGGLAPSKLAYHLNRLRAADLLHERRQGKWVYYSINEATLARFCLAVSGRWAVPGHDARVLTRRPARR